MAGKQLTKHFLSDEEYFSARHKPAASGCWEWQAYKNEHGYGRISRGPSVKRKYAHVASYEMHNGPVPAGLCVLHKCDNPACVNPEHLFLGTRADNMYDMIAKGRHCRNDAIVRRLTLGER